ncbi:phenylacetate--CoA ligase family protein [Flexibacterium corallicola]|uniref:phenylacetate--CoA ligase family protein n=1 Tax=Flexibacterium corallicola TaxID=3037259 RepID=UPI00286F9227|nr:AMP-binding protein [Pseudovibrio sp. M1P-2-3]
MDLEFYDHLETREMGKREADQFAQLPALLKKARGSGQGWHTHLEGVDPDSVTSREALANLPVLRKSDLVAKLAEENGLGSLSNGSSFGLQRVFMSPGPIWEMQGSGKDPWNCARALHAAGFRGGERVHNTFSYHMTPGGFIMDEGLRALGAVVFPAGTGNTDLQVAAISGYRPTAYTGTPDYLKIIIERADELGADISSIDKALVSGGALFPSLREFYLNRGIRVQQCYATAELGVIAYESSAQEGMVVNEGYLVEIVTPGTGDPVAQGDVGEVVVTTLNGGYPYFRFATGDLSAVVAGASACGRTNMRLKGWMGRADQRTKVKGMFVDPVQINRISKSYGELGRLRLNVLRKQERDHMILLAESPRQDESLIGELKQALKENTGLSGDVELVDLGTLPNDGKVISDERTL